MKLPELLDFLKAWNAYHVVERKENLEGFLLDELELETNDHKLMNMLIHMLHNCGLTGKDILNIHKGKRKRLRTAIISRRGTKPILNWVKKYEPDIMKKIGIRDTETATKLVNRLFELELVDEWMYLTYYTHLNQEVDISKIKSPSILFLIQLTKIPFKGEIVKPINGEEE